MWHYSALSTAEPAGILFAKRTLPPPQTTRQESKTKPVHKVVSKRDKNLSIAGMPLYCAHPDLPASSKPKLVQPTIPSPSAAHTQPPEVTHPQNSTVNVEAQEEHHIVTGAEGLRSECDVNPSGRLRGRSTLSCRWLQDNALGG
jgi:hypothetical protein